MIEAYAELSTCRQSGMGIGAIPLTAIQEYSDRHELGDLFVRQILQIDRDFIMQQSEEKAEAR